MTDRPARQEALPASAGGGADPGRADPGSSAGSDSSTPAGEPVACPFCHSTATERIALFGSQLLVDQHRCRACHTYFEAIRDDR